MTVRPIGDVTRPQLLLALLSAVAAMLLMGVRSQGAVYSVATQGSDTNQGTIHRPFRTIQQAAQVMKPGDTCFVRAGVYRETVRPAHSGAEGRPITFAAYGTEDVVVSGADSIGGWKRWNGRIYQAATQLAFDQLFVDGRMMNLAQWPNAPLDPMRPVWAIAAAGTEPGVIVDPRLPECSLVGATVHVLPGAQWVSWTRPIMQHDAKAHTFRFNADWSQEWAYVVKEGSRYYLFGIAGLLDAPGEWHLDVARKAVCLWPPMSDDPTKHRVEVKRRDLAFDLSQREHIRVRGFRIFASAISMADAGHCLVENCHLRYACHFTEAGGWGGGRGLTSGVLISGHDNELRDSSVVYSAGNGVGLYGERNAVRNCLVRNCDYSVVDFGAIWADGRGNIVSRSTLCETARTVLLHRNMKAGLIEYNDMYHAGLMTNDLGITYCYGTDGEGTVISHNFAHENKAQSCGVGIYIDNGSSNFVINHNISWRNPDSGIRLNTPCHNTSVFNNTIVNNLNSIGFWGPEGNSDQAGCRVINNICTDEVRTGDGVEVSHNFAGKDPGFVGQQKGNFRLRDDSPCVDAGIRIPQITLHMSGRAPDLGAHEHGLPPWTAGHTWGEPPLF